MSGMPHKEIDNIYISNRWLILIISIIDVINYCVNKKYTYLLYIRYVHYVFYIYYIRMGYFRTPHSDVKKDTNDFIKSFISLIFCWIINYILYETIEPFYVDTMNIIAFITYPIVFFSLLYIYLLEYY